MRGRPVDARRSARCGGSFQLYKNTSRCAGENGPGAGPAGDTGGSVAACRGSPGSRLKRTLVVRTSHWRGCQVQDGNWDR